MASLNYENGVYDGHSLNPIDPGVGTLHPKIQFKVFEGHFKQTECDVTNIADLMILCLCSIGSHQPSLVYATAQAQGW